MQSEEHLSYSPGSYGRRRFGRNRGRFVAAAVLVAGLVIGALAGRWSVVGVEVFAEKDPPIASKDPHLTVLDEFEGINLVSPAQSPDSHTSPTLPNQRAIITSLYTDAYGIAVSTLGFSLSKVSTSARKIVIYLPDKVSNYTLCRVRSAGWEVLPVEYIPPPDGGKDVFWRFLDQYTKLRIWTLDQEPVKLESIVYLDADTLVKRNFDELFDIPFVFAACSDVYLDGRGFSIGFNAGVLALKPDSKVFDDMLTKIYRDDYKHNEAEQGFLNLYYGQQVVRLPHVYNGNLAIKTKSRTYWDAIQDQMAIVHFTLTKPFDMAPRCERGSSETCTVEEIWDSKRHKEFVEMAKGERNGDFREEIEWWESVYDEMMESVGTDHCTFTER